MGKKDSAALFTNFHLTSQQDGSTIAAALKALMPGSSWNEVKQAIRGRRVQINGNLCVDEARRVTHRDVVKLWKEARPKPIESRDLRLLHVDEHLIVLEKPAGVTSVRHHEERKLSQKRRQLQPTLEELVPQALARYLIEEKERTRPDPPDARRRAHLSKPPAYLPNVIPVHRLDRDTSGLMLFARTPHCAQLLESMFRQHRVDRRYRAVVHGKMLTQRIESYLIRDAGGGRRGSTDNPSQPDAQHAITHVTVLEYIGEYTLVECQLETGRTHQIRIHLSEQGHRLCGEPLYNRDGQGHVLQDGSGAPRQALHSASLQFQHPVTGQSLAFQSPWPKDLKQWFSKLRPS
jgi:23S rRNA pseudouridine1911/1915/1917 synthase